MKKVIYAGILMLGVIIFGALFYFGILQLNYPSSDKYPVQGVDVSQYQGEIYVKTLA